MKKILIVEDTFEVRENLAEILTLSGYEVYEAENGKVGVAKAIEHNPDLILCDVMMPELDGFGVLKILNSNPRLMHIPFMFLTAKADKTDFRKGMGLGADDYITKPFDDVELLEAIEIRLKKSSHLSSISNSPEGIREFFNEAKANIQFKKLSENREERKFNKKDEIYNYGKRPTWLYYVVSGKVKCHHSHEIGRELITRVYGPGDFFGFVPILTEEVYDEDATAIEETVLSLIPIEDFTLLLFNNRDFAAKFIKMLAHHADYSEKQLVELAYSSVRKKVANALLLLLEKSSDGAINIRREDLASLVGTAKETVIRTLSDFKKEGYLDIVGSNILINSPQELLDIRQ